MGKLLRILTVLLLLLSAGALTLGSMLFAKRELLKGRTQKLEKAVIELSAFIEAEREDESPAANFTAKDVAPVTAQVLPNPERSAFWETYKLGLEETDLPSVVIRSGDLMQYYKINPATLQVEKDAMGYPISSGKGTMQQELNDLLAAAESQLARLNSTRHQLRATREELIATIEDLNANKQRLRERLVEINGLNATIAGLEDNIRRLERQVSDLEAQKRDLQDQVAAQEKLIGEKNDEILLLEDSIATLKEENRRLRARIDQGLQVGPATQALAERQIEAGIKGEIVSVNPDWSYAVMKINDAFMAEIDALQTIMKNNNIPGSVPVIELFVKRRGQSESFVTKVRLVQIKKQDMLAVMDIMIDWQQLPVQKGDVVFF